MARTSTLPSTLNVTAQELPARDNAPPIDHTANKPWRRAVLTNRLRLELKKGFD